MRQGTATHEDESVNEMVRRIRERFAPIRIVLFGSRTRGNAQPGSDVDLLVVLPEVPNSRKAAVDIRRALSDIPLGKDVIVTSPDEIALRGDVIGSVLRSALREGSVLYERG